jgi:hypothetical protein
VKTVAAKFVRVFLALALGLALIESMTAHRVNCGSGPHGCSCCANPDAESCCAAPENSPTQPQPPSQPPRASQSALDAILFSRPVLFILPAADEVTFPDARHVRIAHTGGHSLQSLLCVRTV